MTLTDHLCQLWLKVKSVSSCHVRSSHVPPVIHSQWTTAHQAEFQITGRVDELPSGELVGEPAPPEQSKSETVTEEQLSEAQILPVRLVVENDQQKSQTVTDKARGPRQTCQKW